jgi:hypothetical protein
VLPVTAPDGLLFRVEGLSDPVSPWAGVSTELKDFQDVVYAFADLGLDVYLLLDPTLPFVRTDALHIIDIVGDGSTSVCIGNPRSQDVMAAILGTAVDLALATVANTKGKLKGVVLDVVNLWPMGAVDGRLELTCFCPSCEGYFDAHRPGLLTQFRTFPSPWNLLLRDSGTGIKFVDDVRFRSSDEDIVGLSRQKGFHQAFEDQSNAHLIAQAHLLGQYIQLRHNQTVASIGEVLRQALDGVDAELQRVLILEGVYYGWTSGLHLEGLDSRDKTACWDQVWFDPSSTDLVLKNVPFYSYMWRRSRYYIDHFWSFAAGVSDPVKRTMTGIGRLSHEEAKEMLRTRLGQALGTGITGSTSLIALPNLKSEDGESHREGFVGVALTREVGEKFIDGITIPKGREKAGKPEALDDLLQQMLQAKRKPKQSE